MLDLLLQLGISMRMMLPTHRLFTSNPTCTLNEKTRLVPRFVAARSATEKESVLYQL